ncbi:MAG: peptidylprolyl isomerase [Polyangiaceae bacterium]|nr:peptidylprolyl isomerase [Polyangiaceae bacterium]
MTPSSKLWGVALCVPVFILSCHKEKGTGASASASGAASQAPSATSLAGSGQAADDEEAPSEAVADRLKALLLAEQQRDSSAVKAADLRHGSPLVRRAAARALARIADQTAFKQLIERLRDEDPEVVTWAAYGVGFSCEGQQFAAVRALVTRAASLSVTLDSVTPNAEGLEPFTALADGLARCGGVEAEATLNAWLRSPIKGLREQAALALTRLAARAHKLHGETVVSLLDLASEQNFPLALAPLGHFDPESASVAKRIREVADTLLEKVDPKSGQSVYIVRALTRSGPDAAPELHRVVTDAKQPLTARIEAARGLGKLDTAGQNALRDALAALAKDQTQVTASLGKPEFALIFELLSGLRPPLRSAQAALEALAELPLPEKKPERRRAILLRCSAAARVAGTRSLYPKLVECDPDDSYVKAKHVLEVLDRGELTRARYIRWHELTKHSDRRVREGALNLLASHPEAADQYRILTEALKAKEPGVVAVAAEILAAHPDRGSKAEEEGAQFAPEPEVVAALFSALEQKRDPSQVEITGVLLDALAAVSLKDTKQASKREKLVQGYCKSTNATLRSHAEKALRTAGNKRASCTEFSAPKSIAALELPRPDHKLVVNLELDTGKLGLELDPTLAPVSVARIQELVQKGFYNGLTMHRVVPAFVVQFGDPSSDSYGGAEGEPLRCETSPVPFGRLGIGLALSGRDTASSQLFVTLGQFPRLDGGYPLLGKATGDWDRVVEGDVIQKATIAGQ